ncbi:hypothetical protein [Candidatus Carsonella ruddii]|uniref:hypothetical protein n=1 Tax=Carsonella ruddii TaxID=114186 RepID=UPI003D9A2881
MLNILLMSGGKDSNFFGFLYNFYNIFIKIYNCNNYIDEKYSIFNCKNLKKKLFLLNLKKEYEKILYIYFNKKNINIDFYCNKLIKIYLIKKIFHKKILFTAHYLKKIKNFFFSSIDQKKDQNFFLNFKNNIYSLIGYYNKFYINFISKKNNFICKNKKSTTGICFKFKNKRKKFFLILENNMILNIFSSLNHFNLGKKIFFYFIINIKKSIIYITKKIFYFKIIEIIFFTLIKNIYFKTKSQSIKFIGKIIFFKKKTIIIFYKKQKFIEKNILIFYNDLIIFNSKIKKKN